MTFRAMGCDVVVDGASDAALASIRRLFDEREAIFSRFRPESELRRVNAAPAPVVAASAEFLRAVATALAAARATGGLVEPTLGAAIEAAGYDDDFGTLRDEGPPAPAPPAADWRSIRVGARLLERPRGTVLDLNGVVKSTAVDDALALLDRPGFVSAGGDLAAVGPVTVGLPGGDVVRLERGGLATSGTATRRWRRGGCLQHHLIDPATGRPSRSPWTYVTAVGSTCLTADVAAKAGFLLGADGPDWLDERRVAARFVGDGVVVCNAWWRRSVETTREATAA
jgi:thiamine biosynthesis lipoprotein